MVSRALGVAVTGPRHAAPAKAFAVGQRDCSWNAPHEFAYLTLVVSTSKSAAWVQHQQEEIVGHPVPGSTPESLFRAGERIYHATPVSGTGTAAWYWTASPGLAKLEALGPGVVTTLTAGRHATQVSETDLAALAGVALQRSEAPVGA
jgi:hypothetical protein